MKTKKILLSSILTLALCLSLICGATFALFTSTSTANIAVSSGKVNMTAEIENVKLSYQKPNTDNTAYETVEGELFAGNATVEGNKISLEKLVPGDKITLDIVVYNESNVASKYQTLVGISSDNGLFDGLAVTLDNVTYTGATAKSEWIDAVAVAEKTKIQTVAVSIELPIDAGNKYQDKSCELYLTVNAVQGNALCTNPVENTVELYTARDLLQFAKEVNDGNTFAGKTVKLMDDVDLGGRRWAPIGRMINTNCVGENSTFQGNFDGDNHTISNFNVDTVDGVAGNDTNKGAGLFGAVSGTISNLKVTNATIVTAHWAGAIAGVIEGTVEKCSVDNITITCLPEWTGTEWDNGDKAGSIVGYLGSGNVTECTAKNVNITGYRDLGGIVGCSNGTVTYNTVGENVNITYDNDATRNYKNYTSAAQHNIGDYIGRDADENDTGNTGTANYVRGETAGTAEELDTILAGYASNSGESITVELTKDFDMANGWSTYNIGNYNGVNSLTINGNGHKITNLNAPLIMGAFAGSGGITINDLTISNANISQNAANLGIGAFIMHSDASGGVVFKNCKLENSVIKCTGADIADGSAYAGGFIGYSSSGTTTFTGCSVINCTISGQKSAGALIGHAQTNLTVDGCTVTGNTISETLEDRTSPGAAAIVGRVSSTPITVKNTTVSGNTINQGAAVTSSATSVVCANATYTNGGNNTIQ